MMIKVLESQKRSKYNQITKIKVSQSQTID